MHKKTWERTTALEGRISLIEDINQLKQEMKAISEKVNLYSSKIEDMENRLRRNNVKMMGLPERCEGSSPTGFMEKWLLEIFGKESLFHHSML